MIRIVNMLRFIISVTRPWRTADMCDSADTAIIYKAIQGIKNGDNKEVIAGSVNYSAVQLARKIKNTTGITYKQLCTLIFSAAVIRETEKHDKKSDAAKSLKMKPSNFCNYCRRHRHLADLPKSNASKEIIMNIKQTTKNGKSQVLIILAVSPSNVTLKELNTTRSVIKSLRDDGIEIVSTPGRHKSGYTLGGSSAECLSWINNWRVSTGKQKLAKLF